MSSCSHLTGYEIVTNPAAIRPGATLNGGCYPVQSKEYYCGLGYKLVSNNKCQRTVAAKTK